MSRSPRAFLKRLKRTKSNRKDKSAMEQIFFYSLPTLYYILFNPRLTHRLPQYSLELFLNCDLPCSATDMLKWYYDALSGV